jgi:hypothetical protein
MQGGPGERHYIGTTSALHRHYIGTTSAPMHKAIISQRLRAGREGDSTPRLLRLPLHRAFNI